MSKASVKNYTIGSPCKRLKEDGTVCGAVLKYKKRPSVCVTCTKLQGKILREKYKKFPLHEAAPDLKKTENLWKQLSPNFNNEVYT